MPLETLPSDLVAEILSFGGWSAVSVASRALVESVHKGRLKLTVRKKVVKRLLENEIFRDRFLRIFANHDISIHIRLSGKDWDIFTSMACQFACISLCWRDVKYHNFTPPLASFGNITTLDLSSSAVTSLELIGGMGDLTCLMFHSTKVTDLGPLRDMKKLRFLDASYTGIVDLGPLAELVKNSTLDCCKSKDVSKGPQACIAELETLIFR